MIITIKDKTALSTPDLFRLALRSIYEKENFTFTEEKRMHESIVNWQNHLDLKRDVGFNALDEENQIALEIIGSLLYQDENGELDKRKDTFKRHKIDYKKFHRLPEAFEKKDFYKGQAILEQHKKDSPEDYR